VAYALSTQIHTEDEVEQYQGHSQGCDEQGGQGWVADTHSQLRAAATRLQSFESSRGGRREGGGGVVVEVRVGAGGGVMGQDGLKIEGRFEHVHVSVYL